MHDLESKHGSLPDTVEIVTGTGGRHLYYQYPQGVEIRNDAGRRLGPGLDIRGEGGQVLAPPTIHPNGKPYRYEASSGPDVVVAEAPAWLVRTLAVQPDDARALPNSTKTTDRPGDIWAAQTSWSEILERDGWALHHVDPNGEHHWTRPGKNRREGTSATVGYKGSDVLKVFTTSVTWLEPEQTYTKIGYLAAARYGGDIAAASRALAEQGYRRTETALADLVATQPATDTADEPDDGLPIPVDWNTVFNHETVTEWLIEPIIPIGRHVVLYAPAKMGKSLLALEIAAAAATGQPVLSQAAQPPVHVTYIDMEMTLDDLNQRITGLGYDNPDELQHFHYYLLPDLPPLDTPIGGNMLCQLVARDNSQLVVIDTMARVIQGEEDDSDSYRRFDMYNSRPLKKAGIAVLRMDHSGKDITKGQRGSSEKVGYADVVWQLIYGEDGYGTLKATHQRVGWIPPEVRIRRHDDPLIVHKIVGAQGYPAGTADVVKDLERLGVPASASVREASKALRDAGVKRNQALISAACRNRKEGVELSQLAVTVTRPQHNTDNTPGNATPKNPLTSTGNDA